MVVRWNLYPGSLPTLLFVCMTVLFVQSPRVPEALTAYPSRACATCVGRALALLPAAAVACVLPKLQTMAPQAPGCPLALMPPSSFCSLKHRWGLAAPNDVRAPLDASSAQDLETARRPPLKLCDVPQAAVLMASPFLFSSDSCSTSVRACGLRMLSR